MVSEPQAGHAMKYDDICNALLDAQKLGMASKGIYQGARLSSRLVTQVRSLKAAAGDRLRLKEMIMFKLNIV